MGTCPSPRARAPTLSRDQSVRARTFSIDGSARAHTHESYHIERARAVRPLAWNSFKSCVGGVDGSQTRVGTGRCVHGSMSLTGARTRAFKKRVRARAHAQDTLQVARARD